jgi:hypothetical protein
MADTLFWVQGPLEYELLYSNINKIKGELNSFKFVVCSNDFTSRNIHGIDFIYVVDPGCDENEFVKLNYSRQYSTTSPIINFLNENSFETVVKMRSDLEISNVKEFLRTVFNRESNQLLVSSYNTMHLTNPFNYEYQISDWIYIGNSELIKQLISPINQIDLVLAKNTNTIFLKHWVGKKTCEQAMISDSFFENYDFYNCIRPINIFKCGLYLKKYKFLKRPSNWSEFKGYVFSHLSIYCAYEYRVLIINRHIFNLIVSVKTKIIKWLLIK